MTLSCHDAVKAQLHFAIDHAPYAFDTPRTDSTTGLAGPGIDISLRFWFLFLLGVHLVEQAQRDE